MLQILAFSLKKYIMWDEVVESGKQCLRTPVAPAFIS
jgi:hypothetical protein